VSGEKLTDTLELSDIPPLIGSFYLLTVPNSFSSTRKVSYNFLIYAGIALSIKVIELSNWFNFI
jgi:hypothetical protein